MKRLFQFIQKLFISKKTSIHAITSLKSSTELGRWNIDYCNKKINRKVDLSNVDHCGPCGLHDKK